MTKENIFVYKLRDRTVACGPYATCLMLEQALLLYLLTLIHFMIGWKHITCCRSKLRSLGQTKLPRETTWTFDSHSCSLKPWQIHELAGIRQTVFSTFELGGITKHLITGPTGNSKFCFPLTSMFHYLRVSGKQNLLFPLGPVIKFLLITFNHVYIIFYVEVVERSGFEPWPETVCCVLGH